MIVPFEHLAPETLQRLLEDFVTREGTDNGDDTPLEQRVERVRHALARGESFIVYDVLSQQCNLLLRQDVPKELLDGEST